MGLLVFTIEGESTEWVDWVFASWDQQFLTDWVTANSSASFMVVSTKFSMCTVKTKVMTLLVLIKLGD